MRRIKHVSKNFFSVPATIKPINIIILHPDENARDNVSRSYTLVSMHQITTLTYFSAYYSYELILWIIFFVRFCASRTRNRAAVCSRIMSINYITSEESSSSKLRTRKIVTKNQIVFFFIRNKIKYFCARI